MNKSKTLFPPWQLNNWRQVDDSVRGGSSVSHLKSFGAQFNLGGEVSYREKSSNSSVDHPQAVEFSGMLDINTLGGAGFASQKFTYNPILTLPCKHYSGIRLQLLADENDEKTSPKPKEFTFTIATTPSKRMPNGRTASRVIWEANFQAPIGNVVGGEGASDSANIILPFSSFIATYRGRPVPPYGVARLEASSVTLGDDVGEEDRDLAAEVVYQDGGGAEVGTTAFFHTEHIFEVGLMCRSGFGKQAGVFSLRIMDIEAMVKLEDISIVPSNRMGRS
ncbi:hypothetical protein FRB94_011138 [Tulasnella sp. JGI-2019a]|nr:hypothetical protein FRB93_000477 [Tulasnella sp. JGI-2019a]KAG9010002.1 hypothetical protein FRB94_011138 [Tulasnella sp. JGI-2019a]KAG9029545.1 hypothetical protein FRB95_005219 [Tulasnella sp. JGI-2019a]